MRRSGQVERWMELAAKRSLPQLGQLPFQGLVKGVRRLDPFQLSRQLHLIGLLASPGSKCDDRLAFLGAPTNCAYHVSAVIDGDSLTLHFTFTGAPPADAEYPTAEVIETDQALVVLPTARNAGPPGWRSTIGCARTVVTRLTRPLGERVVIDLDASPVMVLAHDPAWAQAAGRQHVAS